MLKGSKGIYGLKPLTQQHRLCPSHRSAFIGCLTPVQYSHAPQYAGVASGDVVQGLVSLPAPLHNPAASPDDNPAASECKQAACQGVEPTAAEENKEEEFQELDTSHRSIDAVTEQQLQETQVWTFGHIVAQM